MNLPPLSSPGSSCPGRCIAPAVQSNHSRSSNRHPPSIAVLAVCALALGQGSASLAGEPPEFGDRVDLAVVQYYAIDEASGLIHSRTNADVFWTHNDSAGGNRLYAFNADGEHLGLYAIWNTTNRDWEDIATGPGPFPSWDYLYIGDIGDNSATVDVKHIYRVPEPTVWSDQSPLQTIVYGAQTIAYRYPDGRRDAETLMVDPRTSDIYVISKREDNVRVYLLPYPQSTTSVMVATHVATLPLTQVTGGEISTSGNEVIVKTYGAAYIWCRDPGEDLPSLLASPPTQVPYVPEQQGEAICWDAQFAGYYTVSEGSHPHLYFYPRIGNTAVAGGQAVGELPWLGRSYPNPARRSTTIEFRLTDQSPVVLVVYGISGRTIRTLVDADLGAGRHSIVWDTKDERGELVANGVYFYELRAGGTVTKEKLNVMR